MGVRIPIKTEGGQQAVDDLKRVGDAGQSALDRINRASKEPSVGLRALNGATIQLKSGLEDLSGRAGTVGRIVSGLGPVGLAAAAGLGVVGAALHTVMAEADKADKLGKVAQSVGVTVESLSALNYAAGLSDVTLESLATGLKKLNVNAVDTARGVGDSKDAFAALGIEVRDANGNVKSADALLAEIATKFASAEDGANKTAIAVKLFGKSGADLIPLLNAGSDGLAQMAGEAQKLGVIITTQTAKAAEQFNDNLTRMQSASQGLKIALANELLPGLSSITTAMAEAAREAGLLRAAWVGLGGLGDALFTDEAGNANELATSVIVLSAALSGRLVVALGAAAQATVAKTAASIAEARAQVQSTATTLEAAKAHATTTAATLAEAQAHRTNVAQLAIYGPARAAAERQVAAAAAASASATAQAAAAQTAHAAAITAASIAARTGAAAMGALHSAMAFFGGPVGLAITAAAGALAYFSTQSDDASETTETLTQKLDALLGKMDAVQAAGISQGISQGITAATQRMQDIAAETARLTEKTKSQGQPFSDREVERLRDLGGEYAQLATRVDDLKEKLNELNTQRASSGDNPIVPPEAKKQLAELTTSTGKLTDAQKAAKKEAEDYARRFETLSAKLDPVGKQTEDYMQAVADLDRAWIEGNISGEEHDRLMQQLATDTKAVEERTKELAKAEEKAAEERQKIAEREAEALRKPFERAAEGIQDTLTDSIEKGLSGTLDTAADVFDQIKRIAIRAAAEMASAWIIRPTVVGTGLFGASTASAGAQLAQPGGVSMPTTGLGSIAQMGGGYGGAYLGAGAGALYGYQQDGIRGAARYGLTGYAAGAALTSGAAAAAAGWGASASVGAGLAGASTALAAIPVWGWVALAALAMFGSGKKLPTNASAFGIVDVGTGKQLEAPAERNSTEQTRELRDAMVNTVTALRTALVEAGATPRGQVHFDIGQRDGIQVAGLGAGQYDDPKAAIAAIFEDMVDRAKGLGAEWKRVFDRLDLNDLEQSVKDIADAGFILNREYKIAEPLNAAAQAIKNIKDNFEPIIAKARELGLAVAPIRAEQNRQIRGLRADFNTEVRDSILAITDPLQAALNAFDDMADERLANARELGANINNVERLNALERQQIIEQFADQSVTALTSALTSARTSANQNIQQYLRSITSGSGSFLSPTATLANAEAEFTRLLGVARGNDERAVQARADIVGAAQDLRAISRETFGSTEMFFERDQFIRQTLGNLIGQTSSGATFDNIGVTIAQGNAEMTYLTRQVVDRLDQLTQVVADQQAALNRLAAR